jgi:hypothetical protein
MRPNPILAAAPTPGIYPGGTGRAALLGEYASALEAAWRLTNALRLVTVAGRDYAGADAHAKAVAAHEEAMGMTHDVACHLHRVLDAIREAKP